MFASTYVQYVQTDPNEALCTRKYSDEGNEKLRFMELTEMSTPDLCPG